MSCRRLGTLRVIWCAAVAAVVLLSCASCTELQPVPHQDINAQQLVGHEIRVTTIDGQIYGFRLSAVTEDALISEFAQIPLDRIAMVERRGFSFWKTAGNVLGGTLAAIGALILVSAATFDP